MAEALDSANETPSIDPVLPVQCHKHHTFLPMSLTGGEKVSKEELSTSCRSQELEENMLYILSKYIYFSLSFPFLSVLF